MKQKQQEKKTDNTLSTYMTKELETSISFLNIKNSVSKSFKRSFQDDQREY